MESPGAGPTPEELGIEVYLSALSDEAKATLDNAYRELLEIEQPGTSPETYTKVSLKWGVRLAAHPELESLPPGVIMTYLGIRSQGIAERGWVHRKAIEEGE